MKYQFKNGVNVEGTMEQILEIAKTLKETVDLKKIEGGIPRGYYLSESKGEVVKIKDMHATHIRAALLKQSKEHFENLGKQKTLSVAGFLTKYTELTDNPIVQDLYAELQKRK